MAYKGAGLDSGTTPDRSPPQTSTERKVDSTDIYYMLYTWHCTAQGRR
ncbi:MAG: hypothetical protein ACLTXT_01750 [Ruminococcus callidus]